MLFDDLGVEVKSDDPQAEAKRLLRRFIELATREPVPEEAIAPFEELILGELNSGETLAEALQSGYQAFLCSNLFLYLREPTMSDNHFTIANRLSHFLTNSRPDAELIMLAQDQKLRDRRRFEHKRNVSSRATALITSSDISPIAGST